MPIARLTSGSWITASSSLPTRVLCRSHARPQADDERQRDQDQVVGRIRQPGDLEAAEQRVRLGDEVRIHAPDQLDHVLEDQEQRVGDEQDHHLVLRVHEAQDAALDERRERRRDQDRRDRPAPRRTASADSPRASQAPVSEAAGIRAERVEAAVGDVDDLHHAVDQREAQRGDEQPRRVDDAVYRDGEELVQRNNGRPAARPFIRVTS